MSRPKRPVSASKNWESHWGWASKPAVATMTPLVVVQRGSRQGLDAGVQHPDGLPEVVQELACCPACTALQGVEAAKGAPGVRRRSRPGPATPASSADRRALRAARGVTLAEAAQVRAAPGAVVRDGLQALQLPAEDHDLAVVLPEALVPLRRHDGGGAGLRGRGGLEVRAQRQERQHRGGEQEQ